MTKTSKPRTPEQRERQREYMREYVQRPEVRERRRAYSRVYSQLPEQKEFAHKYHQKYRNRPEVKEKRRLRDQKPEELERRWRYSRQYYSKEINREMRRAWRLRTRYNIAIEVWARLVEEQNGLCAICQEARATCVDHDHESGAIRGLLCDACNVGIGRLGDSPARVKAALDYLVKPLPAIELQAPIPSSSKGPASAGPRYVQDGC